MSDNGYKQLVKKDQSLVEEMFEDIFNHKQFTGRSGGMYAYEGLGSIYWHMVSKLLLATLENFQKAVAENVDSVVIGRLADCYFNIRAGIGFNKDPQNYGVAEFNDNDKVIGVEEKPAKPKSNYAITGLYFYDDNVLEISKSILPSSRGELEITDINNVYLKKGDLTVDLLGRGFAWLDTGTPESLLDAGHFVQTVEQRQGLKIACLEEIAYHQGWISNQRLMQQAEKYKQTSYGEYLRKVASGYR